MTTFASNKFTTKCKSIKQLMKKTFNKSTATETATNAVVCPGRGLISAPTLVEAPKLTRRVIALTPPTPAPSRVKQLLQKTFKKDVAIDDDATVDIPLFEPKDVSAPTLVHEPDYDIKTINLAPPARKGFKQLMKKMPVDPTHVVHAERVISGPMLVYACPFRGKTITLDDVPFDAEKLIKLAFETRRATKKRTTNIARTALLPISPPMLVDGPNYNGPTIDLAVGAPIKVVESTSSKFDDYDVAEYVEVEVLEVVEMKFGKAKVVEIEVVEDDAAIFEADVVEDELVEAIEAEEVQNQLVPRPVTPPKSGDVTPANVISRDDPTYCDSLLTCELSAAGEKPSGKLTFPITLTTKAHPINTRHTCGKCCVKVTASLLSKDVLYVHVLPTCEQYERNSDVDKFGFFFNSFSQTIPEIAEDIFDSKLGIHLSLRERNDLLVTYLVDDDLLAEAAEAAEAARCAQRDNLKSRSSSIASQSSDPETVKTMSTVSSTRSVTPPCCK